MELVQNLKLVLSNFNWVIRLALRIGNENRSLFAQKWKQLKLVTSNSTLEPKEIEIIARNWDVEMKFCFRWLLLENFLEETTPLPGGQVSLDERTTNYHQGSGPPARGNVKIPAWNWDVGMKFGFWWLLLMNVLEEATWRPDNQSSGPPTTTRRVDHRREVASKFLLGIDTSR